ncbi:MAG: DUF2461 domain-containing protein [Planctomycetota bacterium]|jgi:uncharacterized protein (TIGR02453 family)
MAGKKTANPFGPGLLKFVTELKKNNNRAWFEKHRERYATEVREPALAFIRTMAPALGRISKHLLAVDKKVGGSLMRIHRDVRFSKDKQPYKTNLGISFRHRNGKDIHAPGFYFHVDPDSVFLGAGMWHPDSGALAAVRASIDKDPAAWKRARDARSFASHWTLEGDSVKTTPRGYAADHPMIEDLRRKDFIAVSTLTRRDVTRKDLVDLVTDRFRAARPFMAWQARALKLPF